MRDEKRSRLERDLYTSGSVEDRATLIGIKLHDGEIDLSRVKLASVFADEASQLLLQTTTKLTNCPVDLLVRAASWDRAPARAALAATWCVVNHHELEQASREFYREILFLLATYVVRNEHDMVLSSLSRLFEQVVYADRLTNSRHRHLQVIINLVSYVSHCEHYGKSSAHPKTAAAALVRQLQWASDQEGAPSCPLPKIAQATQEAIVAWALKLYDPLVELIEALKRGGERE